MTETMTKFLLSLGIDDPSYFDLEFESCFRDKVNHAQINMFINKTDAWKYKQLKEFLNGLKKIDYPYVLRISYLNDVSIYDVINLFEEYIKDRTNSFDMPFKDSFGNKEIKAIIPEDKNFEKYAQIIKDFNEILQKIEYLFNVVIEKVDAPTNTNSASFKKMEEKASSIADESINQTPQEENEETARITEEVVKNFMAEAKESKAIADAKKIGKARRYHGDYRTLNDFRDLESKSGNYYTVEGLFFTLAEKVGTTRKGLSKLNQSYVYYKNQVLPLTIIENSHISEEFMEGLIKKCSCRVSINGLVEKSNYGPASFYCQNIYPLDDEFESDDESLLKRVELHLHTNMSVLDGLNDISDYIKLAKHFGHKAIAVTDHGVVHSFPALQEAAKKADIKAIYGSELYMIEEKMKFGENFDDRKLLEETYIVFDLETTGFSKNFDRIIEFGAVRVKDNKIIDRKDILINPEGRVNSGFEVNRITDEMLADKPLFKDVCKEILEYIGDCTLVSHNANFDFGFLNAELKRMGMDALNNPVIDTLAISHLMFSDKRSHKLKSLLLNLDIHDRYNEDDAHRADFDAEMLYFAWEKIIGKLFNEYSVKKLTDLNNIKPNKEALAFQHANHVVVLCKNAVGMKSLFKIVSESHIEYFNRVPCTLRQTIEKYRKDLIIMSSCFNGEIFKLASNPKNIPGSDFEKKFEKAIQWYDYIEVQPLANYSYLINQHIVESDEKLIEIIKKIITTAEKLGKKVVATGDCHYCNPSEKDFRNVLIATKTKGGKVFAAKHPLLEGCKMHEQFDSPDQHFRSTTEMLDCFKFLGDEKAKEIVITNTNFVADQIEPLFPVKDKLYTPTIKNSEQDLTNKVWERAKELYGDDINPYITERINKELNGIISNGYAVLYNLAIKIIERAHSYDEIVGSRGSVGSSLVAMLSGISEVNPLPPHYLCPKCKHFEFADSLQYLSGFDLPDKTCPVCHTPLKADGHNIPFETFLGFSAEKVPDIDLNFSSDFQGLAHDYLRQLFGEDKVYRAGTIGTVKDKTSFAIVMDYFRDYKNYTDENMPKDLINYYAFKCTGVKRTTGAHAGGIIVIPKEFDVFDFTPIQYPGDNNEKNLTTHFDFHKIHDTVLKLDLLGHDNPKILKKLCKFDNESYDNIPVNDKEVYSLFSSPKALKLKNNYLNFATGALGLPEFGTDFVEGVLIDTKPKTFGDLLIISGLTHGTNVWNDNAENLIKNEHFTLKDVIGCRDDIMTFLLSKNVEPKVAFQTMEDVRKGRKINKDFLSLLKACKVPEYYIESCNKIKYLFPKAHAAAYVIMAIKTAYFKVYKPLYFYCVYFTVRPDKFDIETMVKGPNAILQKIQFYKDLKINNPKDYKEKDKAIEETLTVALEMIDRGMSFEMIDFNRSAATEFIVDKEKNSLLAPFSVLDGLGAAVGEAIVEERTKNGLFKTQKEIIERVPGFSATTFNKLKALGACRDLPESNQVSLFDF